MITLEQEVLLRTDLIELVGESVTLTQDSGRWCETWTGQCPFCGSLTLEGKPSFLVDGTCGRFECRRCRKSGDAAEFVSRYAKVPREEAVETLGRRLNPPAP